MNLTGRDLISIRDLSRKDVENIFDVADEMEQIAKGTKKTRVLEGKILATLFFEPSTRTRLSFEAAMLKLGGGVIGFQDPSISSTIKGESLEDTVRVVENYADVIVMRHWKEGIAKEIADAAQIPVINGGDGVHEHPTQALLDLYTIQKEKGQIDGLNIILMGDLKHSRSMKSFALGLTKFRAKMVFVYPKDLEMPNYVCKEIEERCGYSPQHVNDVRQVIGSADVLRLVRIQRERFKDANEYKRIKGSYRVDLSLLRKAKEGMIVLHPMPRQDELPKEVDITPHAVYFKQVFYGLLIRMALLSLVLGAT